MRCRPESLRPSRARLGWPRLGSSKLADNLTCAGCEILDGESDELGEVGWAASRDVGVNVLVEQLIGIELRGVRWKVEQLHPRMVQQPVLDRGRLVEGGVVNDQEDLALGEMLEQLVEEVQEADLIAAALEDLEHQRASAPIALITLAEKRLPVSGTIARSPIGA